MLRSNTLHIPTHWFSWYVRHIRMHVNLGCFQYECVYRYFYVIDCYPDLNYVEGFLTGVCYHHILIHHFNLSAYQLCLHDISQHSKNREKLGSDPRENRERTGRDSRKSRTLRRSPQILLIKFMFL